MKKRTFSKRLHNGGHAPSTLVGVTWYTEEEWAKVKSSAIDPDRFEASFLEWTAMANDAFADLRRTGLNMVKIHITSDELLAWCFIHQKKNDADARSEFVVEKVRRHPSIKPSSGSIADEPA